MIYMKLTHVDDQLPEIRIKLTREAQAGGDTQHDDGNEVLEITIRWCREFEGPEADVIECLVVNAESFIQILHKVVDGEGGIVGLLQKQN
jgi:hypothetical protein